MVLASHTVQVTIEAKTRPSNTAFTTESALRYMPNGERSRGKLAAPITAPSPAPCARASHGPDVRANAAVTKP